MKPAPTINAIPTTYKGITFRSRLEARWARLFDLLEMPWTYEPEGYEWDGIRYLPDFWLPESDAFFEIKPSIDVFPKQWALAAATEKLVVVGCGDVAELRCVIFGPQREADKLWILRREGVWRRCRRCSLSWWPPADADALFCTRCGTTINISDLARQAQNEAFWNPPTAPASNGHVVANGKAPPPVLDGRTQQCSVCLVTMHLIEGDEPEPDPWVCALCAQERARTEIDVTSAFRVGMPVFHENRGDGVVVKMGPWKNDPSDVELTVKFADGRIVHMVESYVLGMMVPA